MDPSNSLLVAILFAILDQLTWLMLWAGSGVLALLAPRLRARGWLVAGSILLVIPQLWGIVTQVILATVPTQTYIHLVQPAWPIFSTVAAAGIACFVGFVYSTVAGTGAIPLGAILFSFRGRIARRHYWIGILLTGLVGSVPGVVVLRSSDFMKGYLHGSTDSTTTTVAGIVYVVWILLAAWPTLAVQVKRWHDRNKPGSMVFVNVIPIVGPIWALVENGFLAGTAGPNSYGAVPTDTSAATAAAAGSPLLATPQPVQQPPSVPLT